MRQKMSVVILTRNEENILRRCLDSVKWADEIVIIDDNSTDRTHEIAKEYTNKVVSHPLNEDFVAQRNLGIKYCSGDWILEMDSDERMMTELKDDIMGLLEHGSDMSAFTFKRINNFCGKFLKYGGEADHRPLRLFKKGKAVFAGEAINDFLKVDGPIGEFDSMMEHYNFPTVSQYLSQQDFYTSMEAKELSKKIGVMPVKKLKRELLWNPLKLFFKVYVKKQGYKDGLRGLMLAILSAWRRFLIYAKYWEMNKEKYDEER